MKYIFYFAISLLVFGCARASERTQPWVTEDNPLLMPQAGAHELRVLSPVLLELTLITEKPEPASPPSRWDFIKENQFNAPPKSEFKVTAAGRDAAVKTIGFKRRPLYAPLKRRDLRISNHLYLELENPLPEGASVEVTNPGSKLWPVELRFAASADPFRWSPVIHVNQEGYVPDGPKIAMVGYYAGSLGEVEIPAGEGFQIIDARLNETVHEGKLRERRDSGYTYEVKPYQHVFEADFSEFQLPGEYRLKVPGLGASFPFRIDEGIAALFARTYALGIYHQRCGAPNELPFTRHTRGACHTGPAEVPAKDFKTVNWVLERETGNAKNNPRHTAPALSNVDASLYPFVNKGKIDVSGGHHDAGDYSKYTINSAAFVHALVFAADNFPGVGDLDNLGIPESGDGKSDILQLAKWEADFLAKMQDADGGFYFLVYPRDRRYEDNVLPDAGDPQVVFPKTTSVTAAAVAALAQAASSPLFQQQFPDEAALYLERAKKGWEFLERAIARHGRDGAYQKITHYGDQFMHDDELAWAATELFLATGEERFHREVLEHFDPSERETRRWTWWGMFEGYGCAIRSYAFGARSGRITAGRLNQEFLRKCEDEIVGWANAQGAYSRANAYGASFPDPSKRFRDAGWFFAVDRAFDFAVALQLDFPEKNDPRPGFLEAIWSNLNFEAGSNPVNVSFLTGTGWRRQREIVHQYAQNDRRVLPPSGIPLGSIQAGFPYIERYQRELAELCFPPDWDEKNPYPFYDRWGDTFNTTTEFVIVNQARGLATMALLMARTPLKDQTWRAAEARITGLDGEIRAGETVNLAVEIEGGFQPLRCVWEMAGREPVIRGGGSPLQFVAGQPRDQWVEVECCLPDGRRIFGAADFRVRR